jgi:prepilin-type N-terminal cleavage/methylation domain-containing protein
MRNSEVSIQNPEFGTQQGRFSGIRAKPQGFTLVELLAAMSILVVITLIVSKLFQQASVAWDTGLRKAENTMKGRAIADFIAQDLASAVQDDNLYKEFTGTGSAPEFWSLGEAGGATRAVRFVKYDASGGGISRTEDSGTPIQLVASNATLTVFCVGGTATNLPVYATVKVVVTDGARTVQYQSTAHFGQKKRNTF